MSEVVLVRYAEIFLKGGNRGFFERKLVEACARAVSAVEGARVERSHARLLVWPGAAGARPLLRALSRVFGVASLSTARVVARNLDAISAAAVEEARAELQRRGGRPTFKVESRRNDKRFQPASPEISRLVGAAVVEALALPVNVHEPEIEIGVEVGYEHAFVFVEITQGPGGLPVGTAGRVELLLSGGIDSPVAGWLMMKRGCTLGATFFHSPPYTGEKSKDKVVQLARRLAAWQGSEIPLSVVRFTDAQKALRDADEAGKLAVVLYRRMMMRVAERIGRRAGAQGLVTGDALAQVASQTLTNLGTVGAVAGLPVLRPCLAHDKLETIGFARKIGTYETSIQPYDDCCSLFIPEHPETRAHVEQVESLEAKLDLDAMIKVCLDSIEVIRCAPL